MILWTLEICKKDGRNRLCSTSNRLSSGPFTWLLCHVQCCSRDPRARVASRGPGARLPDSFRSSDSLCGIERVQFEAVRQCIGTNGPVEQLNSGNGPYKLQVHRATSRIPATRSESKVQSTFNFNVPWPPICFDCFELCLLKCSETPDIPAHRSTHGVLKVLFSGRDVMVSLSCAIRFKPRTLAFNRNFNRKRGVCIGVVNSFVLLTIKSIHIIILQHFSHRCRHHHNNCLRCFPKSGSCVRHPQAADN